MEVEIDNNLELESKKEDLHFLKEKLEEIHPDPYRNINQNKELFEKSLEKSLEISEEFFPLAIQESLSLLKDSHTRVEKFKSEFLPFIFQTIQGKTYIIGTSPETKKLLYQQVKEINNYPLEEIYKKISALSSKENSEVLLKDLDSLLNSNEVLKYYGFSNSKKIIFKTNTSSYTINFTGDENIHMTNPLSWDSKNFEYIGNKTYRYKTEGGNLIFQYNACENKELSKKDLNIFKKQLLEQTQRAKNVIIDLRLNSGGHTEIMRDFFEKIPKGKNLYVASSRRTFSSAMHHLIYLQREKGAKIVGENAGQKANRFGHVKRVELPNSKIKISFSRKYFNLKPGENSDVIEPDIKVPITINDHINGTDPLDKWIEENLKNENYG